MIDKKTALEWLDKQRAIVNDLIVNLTQDEQKALKPELQIINWLAEAARIHGGEMTAVEYLEALNEECAKHEGITDGKTNPCRRCPFDGNCIYGDNPDLRRAVEIVKKWKEEQA